MQTPRSVGGRRSACDMIVVGSATCSNSAVDAPSPPGIAGNAPGGALSAAPGYCSHVFVSRGTNSRHISSAVAKLDHKAKKEGWPYSQHGCAAQLPSD